MTGKESNADGIRICPRASAVPVGYIRASDTGSTAKIRNNDTDRATMQTSKW